MPKRGRKPALDSRVHPPGTLKRLVERLRGREQLLVRPREPLPLLVITYPRGKGAVARQLETLYDHLLASLPKAVLEPYASALESLPVMIVVELRPVNPCGCLGHHHPRGTESRLARRLAADFGSDVAEIDLAYQSIRNWSPQPLSSLAANDVTDRLALLHFDAALLAVFLHELYHIAIPDAGEREVREISNQFYTSLMQELVAGEGGREYGIISSGPD